MPRGILPEVQLRAVKDYISGNGSYLSHASELGVDKTVFIRWVNKYKAFGESAFIRTRHNQAYSVSFKKYVVVVYLNGEVVLCQEKVQIKHAFFKVGLPCQSFCFFV